MRLALRLNSFLVMPSSTSVTSELAKVEYIYNKELTPQIKLLDSFFDISSKKMPKKYTAEEKK